MPDVNHRRLQTDPAARIGGQLIRRAAPWLLAAVPVAGVWTLCLAWIGNGGAPLELAWPWVPELGVALAFRADGLAVFFALLVGTIGGLVIVYAGSYLAGNPRLGSFYWLLGGFLTAMLGLVLTDNLLLLFVCWELTSVTSFFLIGFKHEKHEAREAARRALLTTGIGGLALLGGLVVLVVMGQRAGLSLAEATTISSLLTHGDALRADAAYPVALALILLGCFTKSAQFPFHHWLPAAMIGPTPVSALLHSATMVKAGVFLLARLQPALGGTTFWTTALVVTGTITMFGGALLAVGKRDLKAVLAFTTISALGTLVLLLGIGSDQAFAAMVVFLTVHALYKATLFLVVGNVDSATGTRDLTALGGLRHAMPITATAALLAALSQAGAPPALGYFGKKMALQAKLSFPAVGEWLILAAVLTNVAMVAVALGVAVRPFWGSRTAAAAKAREAPAAMLLGPAVLALAGLAIDLVPSAFDTTLGAAAASDIAGHPVALSLKVWSGLNLESLSLLGISAFALVAGYAVYRRLHVFHRVPSLPHRLNRWTPTSLYTRGMEGLMGLAAVHTRIVQGGRLRVYVAVVALSAAAATAPWLVQAWRDTAPSLAGGVSAHELLAIAIMAAGALGAIAARQPIAAALSVGVTGLGLALVFALYGGVDLAITQLLVETLIVVILAAVLVRLPPTLRVSRWSSRLRDLAIAVTVGAAVTAAVLLPTAGERSAHVAERMLALAVPEAYGRNVVNVILVDFRALDTLGEIVVVAAAALVVWSLLRAHPGANR